MKTKIFLPLIILALFFLGSCETIEIEKLVFDTIYVDKPRQVTSFVTLPATRDTVFIRDTVRIETVIRDTITNNIYHTDTLLQVVIKDSLIIKVVEKEVFIRDTVTVTVVNNVNHYDTLILTDTLVVTEYETRIVYLNTEYIYIFPGQDAFYIPEPFMPHYLSFIAEANARNKQLPGGSVVLTQVDPGDLTGENWVSDSWEIAGFQWVIRLSNELTVEQSKAAIYREMARWQMKKQYSNNINAVMNPLFRTSPEPTTNEINILFN